MKVQIPYKVIIERLGREAYKNTIEIEKANEILKKVFRMPKQKVKLIYLEMKQLKLIEFEIGSRGRILRLNGCEEEE